MYQQSKTENSGAAALIDEMKKFAKLAEELEKQTKESREQGYSGKGHNIW
ncbi:MULTISPECIES: hypothetical protein [unclassified Moorena]|nr:MULTISPECIES: hypothetical protein [unclassified Moorena]NEO11987.1 hypothetical protein [Moorena sp. SIO3E8]NEO43032.1 hypothetical protein [Moorena sp. SIO4A3]NEP97534.1 hypothetical protein [Moorena sp. SIO3F7]